MSTTIDRLDVIWRDTRPGQTEGRRWVIGRLSRSESGTFHFRYAPELAEAKAAGFALLPEFYDPEADYEAHHLFPTFAKRIPSPKRSDAQKMLQSWGLADLGDPMMVLARSGGVLETDRLELAEHRPIDDDLKRPLIFRIAGQKHVPVPASIKAGDSVTLVRAPNNEHDRNAVEVHVSAGQKVGWVPRQYAPLFAMLLDSRVEIEARIYAPWEVLTEQGRWLVEAVRRN